MESRWRVEFTSGAELVAPAEKATTGSVEKAAVGPHALDGTAYEWRGGEGGRWADTLWCSGDAAWRRGGTVKREARWRARSLSWHSGAQSRSHGDLSWCCGEVSFF
jgi:hypothetical protein